jgi:branched-chain amino acid transport system substrate-binding protein
MKAFALLMVLGVVLGATFLSCAGGAPEFRLGGVGPVTGEAATFGVSTKQGIEMAVGEWNAQGGVLGQQIRLAFADDKGDPAEGATVYTKLIQQDKVSAIVGTVMSKVSLAGAPICQSYKIPMISTASTNLKVTEVGDYIFRACFVDPFQGTVGAMFSYHDLQAKTAAVIFDVGNDYTKGLAEFFRTKFTELGGQVVAFEGHASGTTDFKAQLTKMVQASPDVIYCSDYYNDVALIARQARELGFKGPMVGGDGWDSPELTKIGGAAVEGTFFTNHYSKDDIRPLVRDFVARFKAKYNADPDALAALAYDATYIMLHAVKTAGTADGAAIKNALTMTDLEVVSGRVKFDAKRNPVKSAVIIEIKGGQQVYRTTVNP